MNTLIWEKGERKVMSLDFSDDHILDKISSEQINIIKSDMEISNICKNLDEYKKNNRISWEIFWISFS